MVFHVEANGVEVAKSDPIAVGAPARTTDAAGKPIDRYKASWNYTIPSQGNGEVAYRAFVTIKCTYKTQGQASTNMSTAVLAASTQNEPTLFGRLLQFFQAIFNFTPASSFPTPTPYIFPSGVDMRSGAARTLKLGTLDLNATLVPRVEKACKEVRFWIQY